MLLIPGNNSGTGILRNAFDHQRRAYNRRGNGGEYCEIDESLLTVVLSGTLEQIKQLIPG